MGCTSLLYLNLAGTPISDASLRFLGRCVLLNVWIQFFNLNSSRVCFFFHLRYSLCLSDQKWDWNQSQLSLLPCPPPPTHNTFSRASPRLQICAVSWLAHWIMSFVIGSLDCLCDWLSELYETQSKPLYEWKKILMLICVAVVSVRYCTNMLYLSLANCTKFTNKGLSYMANGKGCHKIVHLDLSGCEQVCGNLTKIFDLGLQFRDGLV